MTLIAFATYGDRAEFITDTASYTPSGSELGRTTKSLAIHHLDAAVLTQGDNLFGLNAFASALLAANETPTFDALATSARYWLYDLWEQRWADDDPGDAEATVFLVGWSHEREQFTAWILASDDGFQPHEAPGTFVTPAPWVLRPSDVELGRFLKGRDDREDTRQWAARPPLPAPQSLGEWVHLAQVVREQRALSQVGKTFVAGEVRHTVLTRGAVGTQQIYAYDDTGTEFNEMVRGTLHPVGQVSECHCGSGRRFIDCHLQPHLDQPCPCGRGGTLRACCTVDDNATALRPHAAERASV